MSRRKQAKPQFVHMDPHLQLDLHINNTTPLACDVHVCKNCCAEFLRISDLHEHQMDCSKNPLVLIVSENASSTSLSFTFNSPTRIPEDQTNIDISTEDPKELNDNILEENRISSSPVSDSNRNNASHFQSDDENNINSTITSENSTILPQSASLHKLSSNSSNVLIRNLESTKVAVAQFSQGVCLNAVGNSTSLANCSMTVTGLIEQLVAVQQQQVQQLKLIEQIRKHILQISACNEDTSVPSSICEGTSDISETVTLLTHSSHLSQQLAEAAGLTQSLVSQSAGIKQLDRIALFSNQDSTALLSVRDLTQMADTDRSKLGICSSLKSDDNSTFPMQHPGKNHSASPVEADRTPILTNNVSLPHSPAGDDVFKNVLPHIGTAVKDLNVLTALAQQKKHKLPNMSLSGHNEAFDDSLFKHKCRFCAKVFGSDSALQIHVRSHTGERPYKCNICGNRFSTRGNLKVHFQRHKEKHPNVQMNPYPVPEHLDNVPTSTGIPYGMSMLPDKPTSKQLESRPSVTSLPGLLLTSSLPSLPSIIKRDVVSISRPVSPSGLNGFKNENSNKDDCSNDNFPTLNEKCKVPDDRSAQTYLNSGNDSEDLTSSNNASAPILHEDIKFGNLPDCMDTSETTKLQRLVENIDMKSADPNECMVCHRVLSCQSALKMHYRTHTGEKPYKCKLCGRAFTTKGNLKTHYSVHSAVPPWEVQHSCPICQENYTNAAVLQQHIRMHTRRQITGVNLAEPDPCSVQENNLHENLSDKNMEIPEGFSDPRGAGSSQDSCTFPTLSHIEANEVIHEKDLLNDKLEFVTIKRSCPGNDPANQPSKSPDDARSWDTKTPLLHNRSSLTSQCLLQPNTTFNSTHVDVLEGGLTINFNSAEQGTSKNSACDVCNKTFACQSALGIHYRCHTKERPFLCTVCYRGFSTKGNLKQHMLTHQLLELPVQIPEEACKSLTSLPNLSQSHVVCSKIKKEVNSISDKDGKDAVLGRLTSSAPSLMLLSTREVSSRKTFKQHVCCSCGKTFSSSSALQIHERTHTGEKPFACTVCGRAFTTKGNLKVHMATHIWNSYPARRGRRLSAETPYTVPKFSPVKMTDPPPTEQTSNSESVDLWNHYVTAPISTGLALKTNAISVIQNGSIPQVSLYNGCGGNSPIGGLTASLERTHNIEIKRDVGWVERLGENGACFYIAPFIEESKTD